MTVDLIIKNANLYFENRIVKAGIAIEGDKIIKIAKETNLPPASKAIDLEGKLVLPGLIDMHVHLRDEGFSYKEDFYSGTAAAAAGGLTTIVDMPNNQPVTMSLETLRERMKRAKERILVNVAFHSAFPANVEDIVHLVEKGGAIAFKFFMDRKIGGVHPKDDRTLFTYLKTVAKLGVHVAVHAEDFSLIKRKESEVKFLEKEDIEIFLSVHSPEGEAAAIKKISRIAQESSARIHICHLSSFRGLIEVLDSKRKGIQVSCEITPHHLLLTVDDLKSKGKVALVNPPLRSRDDVTSLWKAVHEGKIDVFASDHAPHMLEEKSSSLKGACTGIPGLETMLPLLLTQVNKGYLTLGTLVRMTSERPAQILGLNGRGKITEGGYADLTVIDLSRKFKIDPSSFYSKAKHSPFEGWIVKGKPIKTFVNGCLIMDEGEIVASPGCGKIVKRKKL